MSSSPQEKKQKVIREEEEELTRAGGRERRERGNVSSSSPCGAEAEAGAGAGEGHCCGGSEAAMDIDKGGQTGAGAGDLVTRNTSSAAAAAAAGGGGGGGGSGNTNNNNNTNGNNGIHNMNGNNEGGGGGGGEDRGGQGGDMKARGQEEEEKKKVVNGVALPLEVGTQLLCLWRDNMYHPVRIIERKKKQKDSAAEAGGGGEYEYYVHYDKFNRRMDEWVSTDKLDLTSIVRQDDNGKKDEKGRTRNQKRRHDESGHDEHHDHPEFTPGALKEHEEFTKVKNIQFIELGKYEMETWYFSPFPPEYNNCSRLFFCEFDFAFFRTKKQLQRHMKKVKMLHPPGDEIYRNTYKTRQGKDVTLSFFEVDGKKEKIFCQNLCYLAKLFLDHKTLFYDVDLFLFYILCEVDERGCHPVGYFSKEKLSEEGYNLACILMFPSHQRKGYGKLLISFSYELTKKEGKVGTPERPLSDLGAVSYYSYWTYTILNVLKTYKGDCISVRDIADITAIRQQDVISTLQRVDMIQYQKGQHVICAAPELLDRHIKEAGNFRYLVDPCRLIWTPYQLTQEYAR